MRSTPSDVVDQVLDSIADRGDDGTWITVLDRSELMVRAKELEQHRIRHALPLFGIPFGVKDSIDVGRRPDHAGLPGLRLPGDRHRPGRSNG